MNDKLCVNEIFDSIDGEGKRAGELATFIRLTGCNLRCSYCDTTYAFTQGCEMSITDIADKVSYRNVTLTGGEPLYQDVHTLLEQLHDHDINVETNGSMDILPYFKYPNVWFTVDYKCKTSGESNAMLPSNFFHLRPQDVVKFVVGSIDDLEQAKKVCNAYDFVCPVYISPVFGKIKPAQIVDYMKKHDLEKWKMQLQLHKFIWKPNARGV